MSVIVLNQSVIHYESIGRGRPVLFLHTWVGSWRYWVPSLQAVAVSHSAYALDLRGFGESDRDPSAYSVTSQAALISSFMDEMGIGRVAIVGHGLGALVGFQFASLNPGRLARFMAVGLPLEAAPAPDRPFTREPDQLLAYLDGKGSYAEQLQPETHGVDPRASNVTPDGLQIQESLALLQAAGAPVLVINGEDDPLQQPPAERSQPSLAPLAHEIVLPACGHFPMLDQAGMFHRLLIDFLALEQGDNLSALRPKEEWRRRLR